MRAIIDGVEKTSRSPLPICAAVLTPCAQVVIASPLIPCLFRVRTSHCAQGPAEAAMPSRSRTRTGLARSMRTKMNPGDREQGRHGLPVRHTPWSMLGSCAEVPRPSRAAPRPRLCPGCAASGSLFCGEVQKKTERLKEGQVFQTRGESSQTQQAAMRTYTKAGLVGLALLSSAEVRDSGTQSPMSPRLRVRKTPEGWSPRPHAPPFAVPPGSPTQRACGGGNHSHRCAGIEPGPATLMRNSLHVVARACCERPGRGRFAYALFWFSQRRMSPEGC